MNKIIEQLEKLGYKDIFIDTLPLNTDDNDWPKTKQNTENYLNLCNIQKWIRDKFDIDINIVRSWTMNNSYYYFITIKNDIDMHEELGEKFRNDLQQMSEPNRSYEQSLKDAIEKVIKIIKEENISIT